MRGEKKPTVEDEWSKLSLAAIKRKTISELAAFVESKVRSETA
jgi:hypothetical protein